MTTINGQTESRLVYEIMQTLGRYGAIFRTNAGNIRLANGRTFHGLPKGFSDLLFIRPDGKAAFLECKVGKNPLSSEQEKFLQRMHDHNCIAGVVRSTEEALELCQVIPADAEE